MEKLDKWPGITDASINNRVQEVEERIWSIEEMIDETDSLVKENGKSKKFLTQNIQEIWGTMERQNVRKIVIEQRKIPTSKAQKIFSKRSLLNII